MLSADSNYENRDDNLLDSLERRGPAIALEAVRAPRWPSSPASRSGQIRGKRPTWARSWTVSAYEVIERGGSASAAQCPSFGRPFVRLFLIVFPPIWPTGFLLLAIALFLAGCSPPERRPSSLTLAPFSCLRVVFPFFVVHLSLCVI